MRYRSLTYTGVYVSKKKKKPNGVYFEMRKRRKKSKLNHALLLFYAQRERE